MQPLARASVIAVVVLGCSPGGRRATRPPMTPPTDGVPTLADIPARIDARTEAPMSDHTPAARSPILDVMAEENQRWMSTLVRADDAAYHLVYQIAEQRIVTLDAEGGALIDDGDDTDRILDVEIRVGSPDLDNTRTLSSPDELNEPLRRRAVVPFAADHLAIANHLWLETDRRYREAALAMAYVRQDRRTSGNRSAAPDFSPAPAEVYIGAPARLSFDKGPWVARLERCSARAFRGHATRGSCGVIFQENTVWFVDNHGTQLQTSWTSAQLAVSAGVKADDGEDLSRLEQVFGRTPGDLPGDDVLDAMIDRVTSDVDALRDAPRAEPYTGPAIIEGRAAGVFFHEVLGHRAEGHRQKDETDGPPFAAQLEQAIMPTWLSIYDDPTIAVLNGQPLNGFYRFDDEGVRAQRASLVEHGRLVGFLMGRTPFAAGQTSNGHGRKQIGFDPVARQGNLVVASDRSVPRADLEEMLVAAVRQQGRPYGMIFTELAGGFTDPSAFAPRAFKINAIQAFRLYPDGRRELVRGLDLVGAPLTALRSIRAASREVETFNGVCGAESGWVPVSASAPSLLFDTLEVAPSVLPPDRPPILSPPPRTEPTTGGAP